MAIPKLLAVAGAAEAFTGLALVTDPSLVVRLLFGVDVAGVGTVTSRIAGIALIALGVACWPGTPRGGLLIYNAAVALYFAYVGVAVGLAGTLLWPAFVLHLVVTALLVRAPARNKHST
jgi:hypothetical protein